MTDPTAQLQGEAIGILGTNLIYLCNSTSDPYVIVTFLLDQMHDGRIEVDFVEFTGPAFPAGSWDPRLLAMRMVQFRVAVAVLLEKNPETGMYQQSVPNSALYKRRLICQRSRFRPVTYMHKEVFDATIRMVTAETTDEKARPPMQIVTLQIDEMVRSVELVDTNSRLKTFRKLSMADLDRDGELNIQELRTLTAGRYSDEEVEQLFQQLDVAESGKIELDALAGLSRKSVLATEFVDRFNMVEPLNLPVLVSGISRTYKLSDYLNRYTTEEIAIVVGGGSYNLSRGLFNPKHYEKEPGGILAAMGYLFAGKVRVYEYPNLDADGTVHELEILQGATQCLHEYLIKEGKIKEIPDKYLSPNAVDKDSNVKYRGQAADVIELIQSGSSDWEKYVPPEVAEILKKRRWFKRLVSGRCVSDVANRLLARI